MGFLDKLLGAINNSSQNSALLSDETERKYYEIAYAMLSLFDEVNYDGIKKYVEYHTGEACDEAKLQKALLNFIVVIDGKCYRKYYSADGLRTKKSGQKGFTAQKIEQLIEINCSLDDSNRYQNSKEDIFNICYKDVFSEIKSEYEKVLGIVEAHGIKHFSDGIGRIEKSYSEITGTYVYAEMIRSLTREKFMENDRTARQIVLTYLKFGLCKKISIGSVASVALRALHFESFGHEEEGYSTISTEECRDFVLNNDTFKSKIDEHPYDTAKYTDDYIKSIMVAGIFVTGALNHVPSWMPLSENDPYYTDMVCNLFWKGEATKYTNGNSTAPNDVYDILWDDINEAN